MHEQEIKLPVSHLVNDFVMEISLVYRVGIKIIIIMGLRSVSASKDVIGDPALALEPTMVNYWNKDERTCWLTYRQV